MTMVINRNPSGFICGVVLYVKITTVSVDGKCGHIHTFKLLWAAVSLSLSQRDWLFETDIDAKIDTFAMSHPIRLGLSH